MRFDGDPNAIPVRDADSTSFEIPDDASFTEPKRTSDGFANAESYYGSAYCDAYDESHLNAAESVPDVRPAFVEPHNYVTNHQSDVNVSNEVPVHGGTNSATHP